MTHDQAAGCAPLPFLRFEVLTKRSDFLRASRGLRVVTPGFVLQGWNRKDGAPARVGFTCSKKVGNAVARNRAKRRLREIARLGLCDHGAAGWDYVLIGRAGHTSSRGFVQMQDDLRRALTDLHGSKNGQRR